MIVRSTPDEDSRFKFSGKMPAECRECANAVR
jgi:hypothetical protein